MDEVEPGQVVVRVGGVVVAELEVADVFAVSVRELGPGVSVSWVDGFGKELGQVEAGEAVKYAGMRIG